MIWECFGKRGAFMGGNSDGEQGLVRLNRRGELITPDWYQQLVADGRVFLASNAARETAEAIGTATTWSDTDPALLLDVPDGKTAIPLEMIYDPFPLLNVTRKVYFWFSFLYDLQKDAVLILLPDAPIINAIELPRR